MAEDLRYLPATVVAADLARLASPDPIPEPDPVADRHEESMAKLVAEILAESAVRDSPEVALALICRHFRRGVLGAFEDLEFDPLCLDEFGVHNPAPF